MQESNTCTHRILVIIGQSLRSTLKADHIELFNTHPPAMSISLKSELLRWLNLTRARGSVESPHYGNLEVVGSNDFTNKNQKRIRLNNLQIMLTQEVPRITMPSWWGWYSLHSLDYYSTSIILDRLHCSHNISFFFPFFLSSSFFLKVSYITLVASEKSEPFKISKKKINLFTISHTFMTKTSTHTCIYGGFSSSHRHIRGVGNKCCTFHDRFFTTVR